MTRQHAAANHTLQRHAAAQGQHGVTPRFLNNATPPLSRQIAAFQKITTLRTCHGSCSLSENQRCDYISFWPESQNYNEVYNEMGTCLLLPTTTTPYNEMIALKSNMVSAWESERNDCELNLCHGEEMLHCIQRVAAKVDTFGHPVYYPGPLHLGREAGHRYLVQHPLPRLFPISNKLPAWAREMVRICTAAPQVGPTAVQMVDGDQRRLCPRAAGSWPQVVPPCPSPLPAIPHTTCPWGLQTGRKRQGYSICLSTWGQEYSHDWSERPLKAALLGSRNKPAWFKWPLHSMQIGFEPESCSTPPTSIYSDHSLDYSKAFGTSWIWLRTAKSWW